VRVSAENTIKITDILSSCFYFGPIALRLVRAEFVNLLNELMTVAKLLHIQKPGLMLAPGNLRQLLALAFP
jgi:hypothetical protein